MDETWKVDCLIQKSNFSAHFIVGMIPPSFIRIQIKINVLLLYIFESIQPQTTIYHEFNSVKLSYVLFFSQ